MVVTFVRAWATVCVRERERNYITKSHNMCECVDFCNFHSMYTSFVKTRTTFANATLHRIRWVWWLLYIYDIDDAAMMHIANWPIDQSQRWPNTIHFVVDIFSLLSPPASGPVSHYSIIIDFFRTSLTSTRNGHHFIIVVTSLFRCKFVSSVCTRMTYNSLPAFIIRNFWKWNENKYTILCMLKQN